MAYALHGKVAVVTGAGSGIGRAVALSLARRGCSLALADINPEGLQQTAAMLPSPPMVQVLDVSVRADVEAFAAKVIAHHGAAHIIVNNAGVDVAQTVASLSYEDFEWLMGINFWGVVYGTKAFLPTLLAQKDGAIVNISSVFGLIAAPNQAAYCSAKFAVRGFTESLRQETAGSGVQVTCVHPGGVKTNIVRSARYYENSEGSMSKEESVQNFDKLAMTTAESAGEIIVRGIERSSKRVLVGPDAHVIDWIQRWLPVTYASLLLKLVPRNK
jgi:NAD(P)-dependent dehydrogenase (short-subunit alcohol dehydrogenase family)